MTNDTLMAEAAKTENDAAASTTDTNAAATGMDASTKQAEPTTDADADANKGEADTTGETKDDAKPVIPEKYELKFEEGVALDADLLAEFETFAKENGLDQERAQALANFGPKMAEKFATKQLEAINAEVDKWGVTTASDKELGGDALNENLATAKKALDAFGSPELVKMLGKFYPKGDPKENLKGTGLGNHPEVLRLLFKVGKTISEDSMVTSGGAPQGTNTDAASVLYPNMKK